LVPAGTAAGDEVTDGTAVSPTHDGVVTQPMNSHMAATKVMSSSTVAIAWASK
jgi:hypothetical protein